MTQGHTKGLDAGRSEIERQRNGEVKVNELSMVAARVDVTDAVKDLDVLPETRKVDSGLDELRSAGRRPC